MKKYKITGNTVRSGNWEGELIWESSKVVYARFRITFLIKLFVMRFLYDWVEVEVAGNEN